MVFSTPSSRRLVLLDWKRIFNMKTWLGKGGQLAHVDGLHLHSRKCWSSRSKQSTSMIMHRVGGCRQSPECWLTECFARRGTTSGPRFSPWKATRT
jgi:hypothetical protein